MSKERVKILENVVKVLNEALALDRPAMERLMDEMRVDANSNLADHPTIGVRAEDNRKFSLGFLGLLNGCLREDGREYGPIWVEYGDGKLIKFGVNQELYHREME